MTTDGGGTTWIWLSFSLNWCFTNLNVAFRAVVGDPKRTLHVYSDVAGSSVVGNRVTDLLREIQYKRQGRGTMYFEPLHIQYLPLPNEVVEIIHIQVAETIGTGGDLVKFTTAIPLSRCTSKRHKKGGLDKGVSNHNKDAQDKSASNETKKEKSTRGFIPTRRPHSSLDRWRESLGVGRSVWCGELRCQKRVGSSFSEKKTMTV